MPKDFSAETGRGPWVSASAAAAGYREQKIQQPCVAHGSNARAHAACAARTSSTVTSGALISARGTFPRPGAGEAISAGGNFATEALLNPCFPQTRKKP